MQKNILIISDCSKTLSASSNPTTWSIFAKSGLLGSQYNKQRNELFDIFHSFESAKDIEKTKQWWGKHMDLFVQFGLSRTIIDSLTKSKKYFAVREGLSSFFWEIHSNPNYDLHIISSGVTDVIESFLDNNSINRVGITISANRLLFDNPGNVVGYDPDIITTLNKNNHLDTNKTYFKTVLLWDDGTDLDMYDKECLKIWFCDEEKIEGYDIYLWKQGSLDEIFPLIKKHL